ncbi:MAG: phosphoglucosamine mutase [Methylacidiphilales bacterium]|nr:phosphoglucosamine mutase [Candidatus Methylacidiphilales bacterium]
MKRKWFGTDGIRGEFGREPMTPGFVYRCGLAAAKHFGASLAAPLFVVGRDTRKSGPVLESALCQGLVDGGAQTRRIGVLPTAAVSMLTVKLGASAGVMISASHNPYEDNGIKFFGPDGFKLPDEEEEKLEAAIDAAQEAPHSFSSPKPDFEADPASLQAYRETLKQSLPQSFSLAGLRICVDTAHGAAWKSTPWILTGLGAQVSESASRPNGENINLNCGSLHPEALQSDLKKYPGAIGICHDGDADRVVILDEDADPLDGDELLAIAGLHAISRGALRKSTVVATVMSNLGLDEALRKAGGRLERTAVGDRYVLEAMRAGGYAIGGEQSGHMLFLDYLPTGDGLLSALQILKVLVESGRPLKELRRAMRKYPQKLYNLKVREKKPLEQLPKVRAAIAEVENEMAGKGRVLVRYSGTENKIRILLEKSETEGMESQARRILAALENSPGLL